MPPTIDKNGNITDYKRVLEFEGKVLASSSSAPISPAPSPTSIPGIDFTQVLSPYKDRKVKIIIDVQLEG